MSGSSADVSHLIESIVYPELLRRGNKVSIGKLAEKGANYDGIRQLNLLDWLRGK